jgi:hypothetical protein
MIITLVFERNAIFFRRKLGKIAENCDHKIDPWAPVSGDGSRQGSFSGPSNTCQLSLYRIDDQVPFLKNTEFERSPS